MFPSRPAIPGKHLRVLAAVLLATAVHAALVIIKFSPPPVTLPAVSLPRSVSVFLGQKKAVDTPVQETEHVLPAAEPVQETPPVEPELVLPVEKPAMPLPEKTKSPPEPESLLMQSTTVPAAEKTVPPVQSESTIPAEAPPDNSAATVPPEPVTTAVTPALPDIAGVPLAGTEKEAYPSYRLNDPPPYPRLARKRGQQGTVILGVLVNREGRVDDLQIEESSGYGVLDRAAVKAVRKWRFEPGRRGDAKVTMRVRVPVTFTLK